MILMMWRSCGSGSIETLLGLSRPVLLAMNRNLPEGMELLP